LESLRKQHSKRFCVVPLHLLRVVYLAWLACVALPALGGKTDAIEIREAWITLPDGARLAADLYLPQDAAADARFPVLLEYLPYRKTEARSRNYPLYSYSP
jgi:predicted acyl esterase